jgi:hypothetical protein
MSSDQENANKNSILEEGSGSSNSYGAINSSQANNSQTQINDESMISQIFAYLKTLTPRLILQSIILDILLEPILYFSLVDDLGEAYACGISSLPDGISILISSIIDNAWDPVQTTSMIVIISSSFLTLIFHKAKLGQIPDALIPGVIGLSYLLSDRSIDKPLVFYATRPWSTSNSELFSFRDIDDNWDKSCQAEVKERLTRVWGVVMVIQSSVVSTLIFFLKTNVLVIINIALAVLIALGLNLWSFSYIWNFKSNRGLRNDEERLIRAD